MCNQTLLHNMKIL